MKPIEIEQHEDDHEEVGLSINFEDEYSTELQPQSYSSSSYFFSKCPSKRKTLAGVMITLFLILTGTLLGFYHRFSRMLCRSGYFQLRGLDTCPYDVLIYRATPAGIAAAIAASEFGYFTVIIEPTGHVGGMVAQGGIGLRDGKEEFRNYDQRTSQMQWALQNALHYNLSDPVFQPDNWVGEKSFLNMLQDANVKVMLQTDFLEGSEGVTLAGSGNSITKSHRSMSSSSSSSSSPTFNDGQVIQSLILEGGATIHAKFFIDASYEGELTMATNVVSYTYGREASTQYNESWGGITNHSEAQFPHIFNPFWTSDNDFSSDEAQTLLPYIQNNSKSPLEHVSEADKNVMAYSYRVCLTTDHYNRVPATPPQDYDPNDFELARRYIQYQLSKDESLTDPWLFLDYMQPYQVPSISTKKYDACCGWHPFGIDNPVLSAGYATATRSERRMIANKHEYFVKGLIYFWQTDPSIPEHVRQRFNEYGYCKDEWVDNDHFPRQLYVREAIRIIGDVVFTQNDRQRSLQRPDSVAIGTWGFDIHDVQRVLVKMKVDDDDDDDINNSTSHEDNKYKWSVMNEGLTGDKQNGVFPFDVPYNILLPKRNELMNLAVPNCPSVSHVMFAAIRTEPTLWQFGQVTGIAAALALQDQVNSFHDVDITKLQNELIKRGAILHWDI